MKKIAFLILLLFASFRVCEALPLGNPAEPVFLNRGVFWGGFCVNPRDPCAFWFDQWSVRLGYYGDFVLDRKLRVHGNNRDNIHRTHLYTNAGYFVINLGDRLDVFGTAGVTKIKISQIEATWETTLPTSRETVGFLDTKSDFSWSVGTRVYFLKCCGFVLGAEGQFFQTQTHFQRYFSNFLTGNVRYFDRGNKVTYKEWQIGAGLSYVIACRNPLWTIIPYAGVKASWVRFNTHQFQFTITDLIIETRTLTIFDLVHQGYFGYAAGVTLTAWGNSAFTLEGRWLNEKAIYANAQFRF